MTLLGIFSLYKPVELELSLGIEQRIVRCYTMLIVRTVENLGSLHLSLQA